MFIFTTLLLIISTLSQSPKLDKHVIPLYGNATLGYYYANLYIGSPPQQQSVITDTGSGLLALPCSKCTSCGYKHLNIPFKIQDSKSTKFVTCVLFLSSRILRKMYVVHLVEKEEKMLVLLAFLMQKGVRFLVFILRMIFSSKEIVRESP